MTQEQEREFRAFGEDWLRCWANWSHQRPDQLPIDIAVAVAGSIAREPERQDIRRRAEAFRAKYGEEAGVC